MFNASSNDPTDRHISTLLIPESVVWLPYAGLVVTVVLWLGYDFYRFHGKNKQKYIRIEEHMTILRAAPPRQRISMVSGIGLRFKRGKPVLGDVWNTSPSSSDVSSCCAPRRRGLVAYSREVTPSDEGDVCSDTNLFTGSCLNLVGNEVHNTHRKEWQIGGEYVKGSLSNISTASAEDEKQQTGYPSDLQLKDEEGQQHDYLVSEIAPLPTVSSVSLPALATPTTSTLPFNGKYRLTGTKPAAAGGGVDDGGGGTCESSHRDVTTQTIVCDLMMNLTQYDVDLCQGNACFHPGQVSYTPLASPRQHRNSEITQPCHIGLPYDHSRPHSSTGRPMDLPVNSILAKHPSGKPDKRPPPLRLDLPSPLYSPTTEIVATKHGFTVEGLEVPHYPGSGGRSIPSSGSDIFKPPDTGRNSPTLFKPLTPSPAVTVRVSSSRHTLPRHSVSHSQSGAHYPQSFHSHRHRRSGISNIKASSKIIPKTFGQNLSSPTKYPRATSSSPRMVKEWDETGETVCLKTLKDPSSQGPQSAPIPSHLYHQDEEGYFSSLASSASQGRRMYRDTDDYSNKGILFFSRLAGIGRHQDQGFLGGEQKVNRSSYKSGGFES